MNNKAIALSLALLLSLIMQCLPSAVALNLKHEIPNWDHMIYATKDTMAPWNLDPVDANNPARQLLVMNVYDTLVFYNRELIPDNPYDFELHLADAIQIPNPTTYQFQIRQNVEWHDSATYGRVTADDVVFSMNRISGNPLNLAQPVAQNPPGSGWVEFLLNVPDPDFLSKLSQPWASIIDEQAWLNDNKVVGSGPYKFQKWITDGYELNRFVPYYMDWPAPGAADYVSDVTVLFEPNWAARKVRFLSNNPSIQADLVDVDVGNYPEVILDPGVRGTMNLPLLGGGVTMHWERQWVQGWYYNPLYPGPSLYFYHLWKGLDMDMTGRSPSDPAGKKSGYVDMKDVTVLNNAWWDGFSGFPDNNRVADRWRPGRNVVPVDNAPAGGSSNDIKADTQEMDGAAYLFGDPASGIVPAYGDGYVDIFDVARLNSEWNDWVDPI